MNCKCDFFSCLREMAQDAAQSHHVKAVRFGRHATAVLLDNGSMGLAMHFGEFEDSARRNELVSAFEGRAAADAVALLGSLQTIENSLGVACANALAPAGGQERFGHFLEALDLRPDDVVGMIGNFRTLVDRVRAQVQKLHVFELIEEEQDGILPACREIDVLPACTVVVITGSTLVNHTLADLLPLCRGAREVMLAGPSTILLPEAYRNTPITWIAGARVQDAPVVLSLVEEASFYDLRPYLHKVVMPVPRT